MVALSLLYEAASRGLRMHADSDRLVVRGPRREEQLAKEILARKTEVMALLAAHPELADLDGFTPKVILAFDGELVGEGEAHPDTDDPRRSVQWSSS